MPLIVNVIGNSPTTGVFRVNPGFCSSATKSVILFMVCFGVPWLGINRIVVPECSNFLNRNIPTDILRWSADILSQTLQVLHRSMPQLITTISRCY